MAAQFTHGLSEGTVSNASRIVEAAIRASTLEEAKTVQDMLRTALGGSMYRPLADTWNNHGLMGASGSYDFKLTEQTTNMQDAVLELFARRLYGLDGEIPYITPHEAASDLFAGETEASLASLVTVRFRESDPPASRTKRLTAVFRDRGCGLRPEMLPKTIFRLGGSHKEDALYLQGAFGMGGAMTYRNAEAVVVVSRRHPDLLEDGEQDLVTVAIVEWKSLTKGRSAQYLVDAAWNESGDPGLPWSCPASEVPTFEPGTHIALISYRTDGIQRKREGDDRSFNSIADTRLFDPVMPTLFTNETDRGRNTTLRGLKGRLDRTSAADFPKGDEVLPFRVDGKTVHLPMRFVLFDKPKAAGGIDKFVANGHAVLFTSNGQVHHHWNSTQLRNRTGFNKIHDRVLVVVETDELPIAVRTSLFTADRNDLVRTDAALRLEDAVAAALRGWGDLEYQNSLLVRESLRETGGKHTVELGRKIGEAFKATGFGGASAKAGSRSGGNGSARGSGGGGGGLRREIPLHEDPTKIDGPTEARLIPGETRSITLVVDAVDSFWQEGRGELRVVVDHPHITDREVTVGSGRAGRVRVMIAVPEESQLGMFSLHAELVDWMKSSGGLGPRLEWTTKIEVVDAITSSKTGTGRRNATGNGDRSPGAGSAVAVRWTDHENVDGWTRVTAGDVDEVSAADLAAAVPEYSELAALGDTKIPTIQLNQEFPPYKSYLSQRSRKLVALARPREQYALGLGLALLSLHAAQRTAIENGSPYPDELLAAAARAAASGVLAVMPEFDAMLQEAGVTEPGDGED